MAIKRTTIIERLQTLLKEIVGTGGYYTNFGSRVDIRRVKPFDSDAELPAINILYAMEEPETIDPALSDGIKGVWTRNLPVTIVAMCKASTPYDEVDKMVADIHKKIGTDQGFNGSAIQTNPVNVQLFDAQDENLVSGAAVRITIQYRTNEYDEEN
jgi:hypothetical protein